MKVSPGREPPGSRHGVDVPYLCTGRPSLLPARSGPEGDNIRWWRHTVGPPGKIPADVRRVREPFA